MRAFRWATALLLVTTTSAKAQVVDYAAEYYRGTIAASTGAQGRLIVADSGLFFTHLNGKPMWTVSYDSVENVYGAHALYGGREDTLNTHYFVVVVGRIGGAEPIVFRTAPFVADTLASAAMAKLDARRQARYSAPVAVAPLAPRPSSASSSSPEPTAAPAEPSQRGAASSGKEPGSRSPSQTRLAEIGPGTPGYKDPSTATLISLLITGGGHIYAGEGGTGAVLLLGTIAAVGVGAGLSDPDRGDYSALWAGIGVATVFALVSIFDAAPAAHRHNRRMARELGMGPLEPLWSPGPNGSRLGLRVGLGRRSRGIDP